MSENVSNPPNQSVPTQVCPPYPQLPPSHPQPPPASPQVNIIPPQPSQNIGYSPYNPQYNNANAYHGYPPSNRGYLPSPPGYTGAIITQPTGIGVPEGQWMEIPQSIPNCPPGLEYLTVVDELMVKQKIELTEVLMDFESKNKFSIKNKNRQRVYFAAEDSGYMARNCLGSYRPFQIKVFDNRSKEVIHIRRPASCDSCLFPCCLQTMEIYSPPGNLLGRIQQEWSFMNPRFLIVDPTGEVVLKIKGPCCTATFCCGEVEFKILSADGKTKIGKIAKYWSGLVQEIGTDAENFGISFPLNLDVRMKAVLIGACFLIDIVYYEAASTGPIKCLTCICGCLCSHCKSNT
ncbi:phospholipid scramblase 2-like [Onthophagus taurus]|uniref:phospholipid scramblase 2-like n=1 Tax=Onthophagus taurus TaxID=166361 RepID=UPI000C20C60E|nr:phospholipid scramblase 2-like [Onthophagus taurus]